MENTQTQSPSRSQNDPGGMATQSPGDRGYPAPEEQDGAKGTDPGYAAKLHETADAGIDRAAEGLEKAANQLRTRAEDGAVPEKVGVRVADGLDRTSQYLRDHEAQEIWNDVERLIKEHPVQAAVSAAVAGYVVAKLVK